MSRVHVIGGGFSGLSVGYYLTKLGFSVDVFEKSARLGGLISTEVLPWGLIETAANGLLNDERVESVFTDLQVEMAERSHKKLNRYIHRGRPQRWPLTVVETARFMVGVLRFLGSGATPRLRKDETFESWSKRYFGEAAFHYLLGPAFHGIYGTSDLDARLLLEAHGHFSFDDSPTELKMRGTVAPVGGMQALIDGMAKKITTAGGAIHLNTHGDLRLSHPTVIATSAPAAALLLLNDAPELARELMRIEYLPLTTATVSVSDENAAGWVGFGCLFPQSEGFHSLGVLFNNFIFKNRANQNSETWIIPHAEMPESEVLHKISQDRAKMLNRNEGRSNAIQHYKISQWPHALPHYNFVLREVLENIKTPPHIHLAGNYLGCIGLAKILKESEALARKIRDEAM